MKMSSKELKDTTMKKFNIQEAKILEKSSLDNTLLNTLVCPILSKNHLINITFCLLFFSWNLICRAQTRNQWLEIDA